MNKQVIASASYYNKKYYLNEGFEKLPYAVKKDLKEICTGYVEKYKCVFMIGFYEDCEIFVETQVSEENEFSFMEIDSKMEIKRIENEYSDMLEGLHKWVMIYVHRKD